MIADHLTSDRIVNSILQRSKFKGSYIIVEGKNDFTLYRKFVDDQNCHIEIALGNSNVIDVINKLDQYGYKEAIGLIDTDFRILDNDIPPNNNIFITDYHDLELMIFRNH